MDPVGRKNVSSRWLISFPTRSRVSCISGPYLCMFGGTSRCPNQVSGECLKNSNTLMVTLLTESSEPSAMMLMRRKLTEAAENNTRSNHDLCLF